MAEAGEGRETLLVIQGGDLEPQALAKLLERAGVEGKELGPDEVLGLVVQVSD